MQAVFDIVLPVFAIILSGFLAGRFGLLGTASAEALNRFVFYFALPPLLFLSTARVEISDILYAPFLAAYFGGLILTAALAYGGARSLFGLCRVETIVLHIMATVFANTAYLGIPLFLAAFGEPRLLPAIVATVFTNVILIGLATAAIEYGRHGHHGTGTALARAGLAVVKSPIFLAPAAGILASAVGLVIPRPVANFAELLGATAGPGALFALGLSLVGRSLNTGWAELGWIVALKLVVHPMLTLVLVTYVISMDPFWAKSAVLLAAMPTGALVFVLAQNYDIYVQRASATIVATTVLSVVTLSSILATL